MSNVSVMEARTSDWPDPDFEQFSLAAITTLVMARSAANANLTDRVAVSQNSIVAIPVPTPPTADIQPLPSETPAPSSGLASTSTVIPVPVPTPPSQ